MAFTAGAEATISGKDKIQPDKPDTMSAFAAVSPPKSAMFVPAALTPMKRRRLTMVTANSPKGTAEANKKKLLTRTADGFCAKNTRITSAAAKGLTYGAP